MTFNRCTQCGNYEVLMPVSSVSQLCSKCIHIPKPIIPPPSEEGLIGKILQKVEPEESDL